MPVDFLTDEQAAAFGRFAYSPTRAELERVFLLDESDQKLVGKRRGAHNKLGFALQLTTVRYLGTFLADPLDAPTAVLNFLAVQLDIADASCVKSYTERAKTPYEHQWEIRRACGYRDFAEAAEEVGEFLSARAWTRVEPAKALFEATVAFIEYGRIAKTQHLLAVADPDDDTYRRSLNAQLNTTESRHRPARKLCFGHRGELRQSYQEGMEDQLGALGLVLNAVVLWNTTYLNAALEQLREQGYPVSDENAARLSPLGDTHINVHGTYSIHPPQSARLRPLRDPTFPHERP